MHISIYSIMSTYVLRWGSSAASAPNVMLMAPNKAWAVSSGMRLCRLPEKMPAEMGTKRNFLRPYFEARARILAYKPA